MKDFIIIDEQTNTPKPMYKKQGYKVKLTYFKKSGKYYSEGTYNTKKELTPFVINEVENMLKKGRWVGLSGPNDFFVLITSDHPQGCPRLITKYAK